MPRANEIFSRTRGLSALYYTRTSSHLIHVTPVLDHLSIWVYTWRWNTLACIETAGGPGCEPQQGARYFTFVQIAQTGYWGPPSNSCNGYRGALPAVKPPGYDVYRSPPSSAEVPICLHGVGMGNVTFLPTSKESKSQLTLRYYYYY
jgi:hypothetical protein